MADQGQMTVTAESISAKISSAHRIASAMALTVAKLDTETVAHSCVAANIEFAT